MKETAVQKCTLLHGCIYFSWIFSELDHKMIGKTDDWHGGIQPAHIDTGVVRALYLHHPYLMVLNLNFVDPAFVGNLNCPIFLLCQIQPI